MPQTPAQETSSIFETSLAELVFILFFILLLFSVWQLNSYTAAAELSAEDNGQLHEENAQLTDQIAVLEDTLEEAAVYLEIGEAYDPEEMFTTLRLAEENQVRVQELEQQNVLIENQLDEIKKSAEEAGVSPEEIPDVLKEYSEIADTLSEISTDDDDDDDDEQEPPPAEKADQVVSELRDFRGQNIALRNQIAKLGNGLDHPPCWADEITGKPQYALDVIMTEENIGVYKGWPESRHSEAIDNQNIGEALGFYESDQLFWSATQGLYNESVAKECRHFVRVYDHTETKDAYEPFYDAIFAHFYLYKYENRYEDYQTIPSRSAF